MTKLGELPSSKRWKLVRRDLFVGVAHFTGGIQCTVVDNRPKCPKPPAIPTTDFAKVVSVATT
jgi:hypothetical protein